MYSRTVIVVSPFVDTHSFGVGSVGDSLLFRVKEGRVTPTIFPFTSCIKESSTGSICFTHCLNKQAHN